MGKQSEYEGDAAAWAAGTQAVPGTLIQLIDTYRRSYRDPASRLMAIRQGIGPTAIADLLEVTGATQAELAHMLSLSEPTLRKLIREGRNPGSRRNDRVLQLFELFDKGIGTFGSRKEFRNWLGCYNIGLNTRPFEVLNTFTGASMVMNELLRIDHGVLA